MHPKPQLRALRFDCGRSDRLLSGSRAFAKALTSAGIQHKYEEYEGDHSDRIRERLETEVLPFFSEVLDFGE